MQKKTSTCEYPQLENTIPSPKALRNGHQWIVKSVLQKKEKTPFKKNYIIFIYYIFKVFHPERYCLRNIKSREECCV